MPENVKALAASYLRVLLAAVIAAVSGVLLAGVDVTTTVGLQSLGAAIVAAAVTTTVNFLRSGETRFGVGSEGYTEDDREFATDER